MKNIMKKIAYYSGLGLFFFMGTFVMLTMHAQAYIDPSAVSYVIQAVAAVVIALGACLTIFRHKIAALFKKGKNQEKKEIHFKEDEDETEDGSADSKESAAEDAEKNDAE